MEEHEKYIQALIKLHLGMEYIIIKSANRVAGGFSPPAPTTPCMRVRTGRFTKINGRLPDSESLPTIVLLK